MSNAMTYGTDEEKRQLYESCRKDIENVQKRLDEIAAKGRSMKRKAM